VRDEPPRALDFCSLAALCDVFFPRIFVKRASWVPIGTHHLLAHARANQFRNGYFDQSAELWGPGGELLAVTHRIVYYKE
jgi:hypothetical protein